MNTRDLTLDALCPRCKFGLGLPYDLSTDHRGSVASLRCPDCGHEWTMITPPSPLIEAADLQS
jgi:hypothetical protein